LHPICIQLLKKVVLNHNLANSNLLETRNFAQKKLAPARSRKNSNLPKLWSGYRDSLGPGGQYHAIKKNLEPVTRRPRLPGGGVVFANPSATALGQIRVVSATFLGWLMPRCGSC
jgi:hypothetical protein